MKKTFLAAILGLILTSVSAQSLSTPVPALVKTSFDTQYPHAKRITWTSGQDGYNVSFETRHKKCFVEYDESGKAVGQVVEIYKIDLPRGIRKKLEHNYSGFVIENASKIDNTKGSFYEASVARSEEGFRVIFTAQGEVVSVEEIE